MFVYMCMYVYTYTCAYQGEGGCMGYTVSQRLSSKQSNRKMIKTFFLKLRWG